MNGRRVRPLGRRADAWAGRLAIVGILLLMLVPAGVSGIAGPHGLPAAPRAAPVPVAVAATQAALASLAHGAVRTITPDPWQNLSPSLNASPSPREGEALVYDPADGYVLLFGGATGAGAVHDTWTFSHGHWTNPTAGLSRMPPSRYKAMVTYDAADGYVLLFGGRSSTYLNDTWKWSNGTWSPVTGATSPPAREDGMMAYDAADGYVVLFGGEDASNHLLNDTWTYVGGAWTNLTSSIALSPPTREAGGIAWDTGDGYVLLFGGSNDPRGDLHDTWSFRGGVWTNRTDLTAANPTKRETLVLADDPVDGFVLLFGGLKFPTFQGDSWAYSNGSWTLLNVGTAPAPRWGAEATWDANGSRGFVLLFGGVGGPNATYFNDTWSFKVPLSANLSVDGPTEFDLGGSTNLSLQAQGGYSPYSYGWQGLPAGCPGANASTLPCAPTSSGSYNITGWVVDAAGTNVTSASVELVVRPLPTVTATLVPIDGNAPFQVLFNATVQGGVAPFTYAWQFGDGGASNASAGTYTYLRPGTYTPTLTIQDADGHPATAPGLPTVTVQPALRATVSASVTSGIVPLPVDFSATVTGGWAPYTYLWQLGPAGVTSSQPAPSYTFLTPGHYEVTVNVTDSVGATFEAFTNVTVSPVPPLVATASASPDHGTPPLYVTFTGGASGGTAPYTFNWSFGDGSPDGAGATLSHTYATVGNYTATVTATDSVGATSEAAVQVSVAPPSVTTPPFVANFSFVAGAPYCAAGSALAAVTLSATASGGTAPYLFAWTIAGAPASGASPTVTVPAGATSALVLNASDASGHTARVTQNVSVAALSCSTSSGQNASPIGYLLLVVIAVVAVVVALEVVLLLRRKRA